MSRPHIVTTGYEMRPLIGGGQEYEHIALARIALGHSLPKRAEVHHVDGDSLNNAKNNLVICQDRAYHILLHARTRIVKAGGNPNTDAICGRFRQVKPRSFFSPSADNKTTGVGGWCLACHRTKDKLRRDSKRK